MSDSDEDYMSDAILAKCPDVRPGILPKGAAKQYRKQEKAKEINLKNRNKPLKVLEGEKRNEGLNKAIGEENRGFSILQKMGYKPGMMLGKKGTGRAEPIPINVRSGRGGLGQEAERKRKQEQSALMRASRREKRLRQEAKHLDDYRLKQSRMMAEKEAESDLHKSQRVCEELDEAEGVTEPEEMYYWTEARMALLTKPSCKDKYSSWDDEVASDDEPPMGFHFTDDSNKEIYKDILNRDDDDDTDEEEDELPSTFEQLEKLTHYLRSKYLYCVWCGTRYDDTDDLKQNCPGDTAKAHDD